MSYRLPSFALTLLSALLLAVAGALALGPTPALLWLGLGLSALPAPGFLLLQRCNQTPQVRQHPVLVSVLIGFGCVITLIGVQRFGEAHRWIAFLALLALVAWMLFQRFCWRNTTTAGSDAPKQSD